MINQRSKIGKSIAIKNTPMHNLVDIGENTIACIQVSAIYSCSIEIARLVKETYNFLFIYYFLFNLFIPDLKIWVLNLIKNEKSQTNESLKNHSKLSKISLNICPRKTIIKINFALLKNDDFPQLTFLKINKKLIN